MTSSAHAAPADPLSRPTENRSVGVRAVDRVLNVLEIVAAAEPAVSLSALAEMTEMPKPTAFRYAVALERRGYLSRYAEGNFRLGPSIRALEVRHLERMREQVWPHLASLRDRFQETCNLGQLDGDRIVYLEILESPLAMRLAARIGDRSYVHSTALGKAIAAGLTVQRVDALIAAQGMPRMTHRTIINPQTFREELDTIKERGYAVDAGENEPDSLCVAVAIPITQPPMAISVSAPATRLKQADIPVVAAALHEVLDALAAGTERPS